MMKTAMRLGLAVVLMGLFANLLWGGSAGQKADVVALIKGGALVVDVRSSGNFREVMSMVSSIFLIM